VASRAEPIPAPPSLRGAIRAAATDFYFHSWRLLPANVFWAVVALAIVAVAILVPPLLVLVPLAALPTAGIFRIAARIVRGEAVSFWDGIGAWRSDLLPSLALGTGLLGATIILGFNVATGLLSDSLPGWAFATLAFWGLVGTWLYAWVAWPILLDPVRAAEPARERLRLAALLILAHPLRVGGLGLVLAVLVVVSTVAVVALVTVGVSFGALVSTRYVLPAADRLAVRLAVRAALARDADGRPAETPARS
jgi:uncharacterized membrane protein YesL